MSQSAKLYLLSPLAWTHAQDLLARESEMIARGVGAKKRRDFLERECVRLQDLSEVSFRETLDAFSADLSQSDVDVGIHDMRERFRRHGFTGTSRTVRNTNRRLGNVDVGLDVATILAGINILGQDEVFAAAASRVFTPFFELLTTHPAYADGEAAFNVLQEERLLPSDKDKKAQALALEMIRKALEGIEDYSIENKRDAAYLRGRLLDIDLADVMTSVLTTGGVAAVESIMRESIEVQLDQYWSVLWIALDPRVTELGGWSEQEEDSETNTSPTKAAPTTHERISVQQAPDTSPLLSLADARSVLNVSRTTVFRLIRDNALELIKVRRRSMVTRASVEAYISSK